MPLQDDVKRCAHSLSFDESEVHSLLNSIRNTIALPSPHKKSPCFSMIISNVKATIRSWVLHNPNMQLGSMGGQIKVIFIFVLLSAFLILLVPFYARNIEEYSVFQSRPYIIPSRAHIDSSKSLKTTLGTDTSDLDPTHQNIVFDYQSSEKISLPPYFNHLARVDEPLSLDDVPFLFHIPRSGASTLKDIMSSCLGLVGAADVGVRKDSNGIKSIQAFSPDEINVVLSKDGSQFLNLDTSTEEGINQFVKAHSDVLSHGLVQYLSTQHMHLATQLLFTPTNKGRLFAIFRNPIDRAISIFHYLPHADWEPTHNPSIATMSLERWAQTEDQIEFNWMTRFLSNELEGSLTREHLEVAKMVLKNYCLVGLLDRKEESWTRFESYFGWNVEGERTEDCKERYLEWGWSNKHSHPDVNETNRAYDLLVERNKFDIELYEFAIILFGEQRVLV